jgi:hypothetical protein
MLARHRPKILVASATATIVAGVFVAVSANSESAQSPPMAVSAKSESPQSPPVAVSASSAYAQRPGLVPSALAEGSAVPAPEGSMVPTAAVAEPRRSAGKANRQRRVVQDVPPPQPPRIATTPQVPLIMGIHF